jgi:hypothetical protein
LVFALLMFDVPREETVAAPGPSRSPPLASNVPVTASELAPFNVPPVNVKFVKERFVLTVIVPRSTSYRPLPSNFVPAPKSTSP